MLSRADDYPVHQRPEPIAQAGTDRNFYDRYFFNAQDPDGSVFFGAALGVYPHLDVMDGAFALLEGGTQRSVFVSRHLGGERMATRVGPLAVEVLEPLQRLRVRLDDTSDLFADLVFEGLHPPVEEPRFTWRIGPRTIMDATRMTQNVSVSGTIRVDGRELALAGFAGTRDRSWGIRPIGAPDAQPPAPPASPQFFWLWAPLVFPSACLYAHVNEDGAGRAWNRAMRLIDRRTGAETELEGPRFAIDWLPGSRTARAASIEGTLPDGGTLRVELAVRGRFFMHGLGYGHPRFGHGLWRGPLDVAAERFEAAGADLATPMNAHVQALVAARLIRPGGRAEDGQGVLEQLVIGPHAPSGFRDLFDLA